MIELPHLSLNYTVIENAPICPICGRHGKRTDNVEGSAVFEHRSRVIATPAGPMPMLEDFCEVASPLPERERKARLLWLALLDRKNGKTLMQRQRNFEKAKRIASVALEALLIERGLRWNEKALYWL